MAAIKSRTENQRILDRILCIKGGGCYSDRTSIGAGGKKKTWSEEVDLAGKM